MIIPQELAAPIFSAQLRALPDLWEMAESNPDQVTAQVAVADYSLALAGNAGAGSQKIVAGVDEVIGWAPWQRQPVLDFAAIPTEHLLSGEILRALLPPIKDLARLAWAQIRELVEATVEKVLWPLLELFTVVPVVGWALDVVLGWVQAIVELVKLAKESERAQQAEGTVRPAAPHAAADESNTRAILDRARLGDWSALWMPTSDPVDATEAWRRGWGCALIAPDAGTYAGGRLIRPVTGNAWTFTPDDPRGTGFRGPPPPIVSTYGPLAFGGVPSGGIHRLLQCNDGASLIVDTGAWLRLSSATLAQCWSALWETGPATWAVDTELCTIAWSRYVEAFLEDLDSGQLCRQVTPASRTKLRRFFVTDVLGYTNGDAPIDVVLASMPMISALNGLRQRQEALSRTTAIAYANARTCPPGLREIIERRQAEMLESPQVCRIELDLVSDPVWRAKLELAIQNRGLQCYMAGDLQAPLVGPDPLGPGVPPPPPPPPTAFPRTPGPPRVGSSGGSPRRAPVPNSAAGGGAGLGLLALAVLAGLVFSRR